MQRSSVDFSARAVAPALVRPLNFGMATLAMVALIYAGHEVPAISQEQPPSPEAKVPAAPTRLAVPEATALQAVQAKIRELYGPDIERAKKPAEKIAVAQTVLKVAGDSTGDPTTRYALLILGRDLAIGADDLALALQTTTALTQDYELDPLDEPYKILAKWIENTEPNPPGMAEAANASFKLAEECATRDDYPNALKFARIALDAAKKSRSATLVKQITAFGTELTTRQKEAAEIKAAEDKLAADPNDPAANMTLGRWHWFRKNDSTTAFPYLAKTVDSPLKKAALTELEKPTEALAQLALAEQWWTLAQAIQDAAIKNAILMRAADWYESALPKLTSLDKVKAERRIAELKPLLAKSQAATPAAVAPPAAAPAPAAGLTPAERLKLAQAEGGSPESEAAIERGLKWIASVQAKDGGWNFDTKEINPAVTEPGSADIARNGATGMALMPFLAAGYTHQTPGPYQATIKRGLEFLCKNVNRKYSNANSIAWFEEQGTMYSHGIAAAAMCDAYAKSKDKALLPFAQGGINFIVAAQDPAGGGWRYAPRQPGDTSVHGWQMMALKSGGLANLKMNPATLNQASKFLDTVSEAKDNRALYGYTSPGKAPAVTAIGLLCRINTGWKKDNPGLKSGVEYLTKLGPNKTNNYFNHYANNVLYQWGGEEWKSWNKILHDQVVTSQATNGVDAGSWHPGGKDHSTERGGRLLHTALSCLMLEVYYRYPRVLGN